MDPTEDKSAVSKEQDPSNFSQELNRLNEALKHAENIENLTNSVNGNPKEQNEDNYAKIIDQKRKLLEEMAQQESRIKKKRFELESTMKRTSHLERKNYPFGKYDPTQYVNSSDEEECTFQPKINRNAARISNRGLPDQSVTDLLYRDAHERKIKEKEYQKSAQESVRKSVNSTKMDNKSMMLVVKRIEKSLRGLIEDIENPETKGYLNFENLGTVLYRIGLFQNLEFTKSNKNNESSLSLNELKIKPERLSQEIIFHENFWNVLNVASSDPNLIISELLFDFLMILTDDKTQTKLSAQCLEEIMDKFLEKKGEKREEEKAPIYPRIRDEKKLWSIEKVVLEFRKLFNDKTTFMNLYSASSNIMRSNFGGDNEKTSANFPFKPQINPKSKVLDSHVSPKSYITKIITSQKPEEGKSLPKNRHEILYEHHRYLKEKKKLDATLRVGDELKGCTFKPKISKYKRNSPKKERKQDEPLTEGEQEFHEKFPSPLDVPKGKRHEFLYQVAKIHKEKIELMQYEGERLKEEKELENCTFHPYINDFSPERYNEGYIPKGYEKVVQRLKNAEMIRQYWKEEFNRIPRGENYEKNKEAEFRPPSFLQRPKIKREEVLVYVDVNVGPGKTGRIGIHKGDDPKVLAKNFARTYSLNANMRESLEKLLQSYIDSYFPKEVEGEEVHEEAEEHEEHEEQEEGEEGQEGEQEEEEGEGEEEAEEEGEEEGEEEQEEGEEEEAEEGEEGEEEQEEEEEEGEEEEQEGEEEEEEEEEEEGEGDDDN